MKRFFILLAIAMFCVGTTALAEESVLIDFAELTADYPADNPTQHSGTLIDFSSLAGSSFSEEDKALMKTSLAAGNWEVELASSSRTVGNQSMSLTRPAPVNEDARQFAGQTVMGVRVHFPTAAYNSWAMLKPPFEIPAYSDPTEVQDDGSLVTPQDQVGAGDKFVGYGVIKNVGVIKKISMNVMGLNFPHGVAVVLRDQNNEDHQIFLDYLDFDGWRTLEWQNPNYVAEVRNRELRRYPLYPKTAPFYKLVGIVFYRDASTVGGDFISYVKDVTMTYDLAILDVQRGINDEAVWGILSERERERREAELRRRGNVQVLRYLERQKMHQEEAEGVE
jgi:hypothetical protein